MVQMSQSDKPIVWLYGQIRTPPFSAQGRLEAGYLLRKLQRGESLSLPHSRPMPAIGPRVHELRINDRDSTWRIIYRVDKDAIVITEVYAKKTGATPRNVINVCKERLGGYDRATRGG